MENRFTLAEGSEVFEGNELIVKGALEAGVSLFTGYPGSPVAGVFTVLEQISDVLKEYGIKGIIANNENQAASMLHGAMSVPGVRAMAVFKSVGAYVALDGMAIVNYTIPEAGSAALCVAGDDPALSSTQVGADSRYTFFSAKIPVFEPATNQEIKDWIKLALDIAGRSQLLAGMIITTNQADGGGTVIVHPNVKPVISMHHPVMVDTSKIRVRQRVAVPPNSGELERDIIERRMPLFLEVIRESGLNRVEPGPDRRIGFVTSGNTYNYLRHALYELGTDGEFPVLKLGVTYPVDPEVVLAFAANADELFVVEEKRGFIESQVVEILRNARQEGRMESRDVWGKRFPDGLPGIPEAGALNPGILIKRIGNMLLARLT
ncbi:MAG: hypothetical protein GXO82_04645 [Chlorobi bacterium]|nr:hypothetical protein [Chlorobiota bacterium]